MTDLDLDALSRQFEAVVWRYAHEDVREGRVRSCAEIDGMRGWYTAKVGSKRTHTVEFQLARAVAHGQCSCDTRYDCRHLAAAVITLANPSLASEVRERKALREWLDDVSEPATPADKRILPRMALPELPASAERSVRYVLTVARPGPDDPPQVRIDPWVGAFSTTSPRPKRARLAVGSGQTIVPAGVTRDDLELWHELRRLQPQDGPWLPPVQGAAAMLDRLANTGRLRWHAWDGPTFKPTEHTREATAQWIPRPDGRASLRFIPESPNLAVLPLDALRWLDPGLGETGPLHVELDAALRHALLRAPALRVDVDLGETLRERIETLRLPPPLFGPVETMSVDPTPILYLQDHGDERSAIVGFEYAGVPIAVDAVEHSLCRWNNEALTVFDRDAKAEAEALESLVELGVPAARADGRLTLDDDAWITLHDAIPVLESRGWERRGVAEARVPVVEPSAWYVELDEQDTGDGWFSLELGVDLPGAEGPRRVNLLPVLLRAIEDGRLHHDRIVVGASVTLRLDDGTLLRVDGARVQRILDGLLSMSGEARGPAMRLRASAYDAAWLSQLEVDRWQGNPELMTLGDTLRRGVGPDDASISSGFVGELRDYQRTGVAWIQLLRRSSCGGVLADDMGLGKTVQVLVHLLGEQQAGRADRPSLVVAPVSVLGTWQQQAESFTPALRVGLAHGPERAQVVSRLSEFDIVLTSYATLLRDDALREHPYHLVALDEAQAIKNPRAKIAIATRALRARQRLALTGTPVENNLIELWSIFRFVAPGLLGSQRQFTRSYAKPIERGAVEATAALRRRTAPFLLRRTKDAVLTELPPKTEVVRTVVLSDRERELYETMRRAVSDEVRDALARKGLAMSRFVVLEALLRLRQICCDARLAPLPNVDSAASSSKLDELMALLEPLLSAGHRVLVFSQFTKMLDLVAAQLDAASTPYLMLTGKTRGRQALVDRFQAKDVPLMLVSLKAGGTGLNLTAADTVVLYDPWWNPAVEQQAIDRTHRIGQERPVTVYRLVCEGSVEERILGLQEHKRALAEAVQADATPRGSKDRFTLDEEDVQALLAPLSGTTPQTQPVRD